MPWLQLILTVAFLAADGDGGMLWFCTRYSGAMVVCAHQFKWLMPPGQGGRHLVAYERSLASSVMSAYPPLNGRWNLCSDCRPFVYPMCADCVRVDAAVRALRCRTTTSILPISLPRRTRALTRSTPQSICLSVYSHLHYAVSQPRPPRSVTLSGRSLSFSAFNRH